MQWKNLSSDLIYNNLLDKLSQLDCLSALYLIAYLRHGIRIYFLRSCVKSIQDHINTDTRELGGLLLGEIYEHELQADSENKFFIIITKAIPSRIYQNSHISLEMNSEVWNEVNNHITPGNIVVGWYHSHPNLGAFFSAIDRETQRAFFNNPYSIGLVLDPLRDEHKIFCGMACEEYKHNIFILEKG